MVPSVGNEAQRRVAAVVEQERLSRGNKFRNQMSNAQAKLLFLFQWAAKPVKLYGQFGGTPTAA